MSGTWRQKLDDATAEADALRSLLWTARQDVEDLAQKRHDCETLACNLLDVVKNARQWVMQYESLPDHAPAARAMLRVLDRAISESVK